MYTLYWDRRTRAASVHMALVEAGIPFQIQRIDMSSNEHKSAAYLAINPSGLVPTMITSNGDVILETPAMLMHIAEQDGTECLAPKTNDPLRNAYLDWFSFHTVVLQDSYKRFYFPQRYSTQKDNLNDIKESAAETLGHHWQKIETHLSENGPYHLGDRFSLLDIMLVTFSAFIRWKPDFYKSFPAIANCYELVKSRPELTDIIIEHAIPSGKHQSGS